METKTNNTTKVGYIVKQQVKKADGTISPWRGFLSTKHPTPEESLQEYNTHNSTNAKFDGKWVRYFQDYEVRLKAVKVTVEELPFSE